MKCLRCTSSAEGYAVIPGVGEAGEIRFYCDGCSRSDRVRMRYWDARELRAPGAPGPAQGDPDYLTLVFAFEDLARMRHEDLRTLLEWVEENDLAAALAGSPEPFRRTVFAALPRPRSDEVRNLLREGSASNVDPAEARRRIAETVRKL
jgi:hypothetical protein